MYQNIYERIHKWLYPKEYPLYPEEVNFFEISFLTNHTKKECLTHIDDLIYTLKRNGTIQFDDLYLKLMIIKHTLPTIQFKADHTFKFYIELCINTIFEEINTIKYKLLKRRLKRIRCFLELEPKNEKWFYKGHSHRLY
jgi:hypothetical protein